MTTAETRIKELRTRQMYLDSSMTVKLRAENGYFFYDVWAWLKQYDEVLQKDIDKKFIVITGKYNGEDPLDLIQLGLKELGIKKLKLGVPQI